MNQGMNYESGLPSEDEMDHVFQDPIISSTIPARKRSAPAIMSWTPSYAVQDSQLMEQEYLSRVKEESRDQYSSQDDDSKIDLKRKKHNELEIRRRKKMAEKYEELSYLLLCPNTRSTILESAIKEIKTLRSQLYGVGIEIDALKKQLSSGRTGTAPATRFANVDTDSKAFIQNIKTPALLSRLDGTVFASNDALSHSIGFANETIEHSSLFTLIQESDLPSVFNVTKDMLAGKLNAKMLSIRFMDCHGMVRQFECLLTIAFNEQSDMMPSAILIIGVDGAFQQNLAEYAG